MAPRIFSTAAAWRRWLEKNHSTASEIWLAYYKKSSGRKSVTYQEALDEALCYGWIDSIIRRVDDEKYMQRFTPRKPGSIWSARNKAHVARLITEGRIAPAGMAKVEAARKDKSWQKSDRVEAKPKTPPDLLAALEKHPVVQALWDKQPPSQKQLYSRWVLSAKRPETRARRVEETIRRVRAGRKAGI